MSIYVRNTRIKDEYLLWHQAPEDNSHHIGIIFGEIWQPRYVQGALSIHFEMPIKSFSCLKFNRGRE